MKKSSLTIKLVVPNNSLLLKECQLTNIVFLKGNNSLLLKE
jgi:hypothetical protein